MSAEADPEEIIILTKDEVSRILERFKNSPVIYYAALTAYYTGMRVSEVYGLTWDCVDFENKQITINKIIKKIEIDGKTSEIGKKRGIRGKSTARWYFGACKNNSSYRTIDIGDTLVQALKEYKEWQEANEVEYGEYYTKQYLKPEVSEANKKVNRVLPFIDSGFEIPLERSYPVFIKQAGEYRGTDPARYLSKVVNYELGIHFNFRAFRHTHATMLIEQKVDVNTVADRLGHSNTRTTLDTYVHVTNNMKNTAVDIFETAASLGTETNVINFADIRRKVGTVAN